MKPDIIAALGAHRATTTCGFCGAWPRKRHERDCPKAKRARNNGVRGGRWELEATRILTAAYPDARKTGPLGGPDDLIAGPLFGQAKAEARMYPKALDRLLTEVEAHCTADQYPALLLKHPGHERRHKLIVMDLLDFVNLLRETQRG